jgi:DNA-binding XRE family transcriptional regulator
MMSKTRSATEILMRTVVKGDPERLRRIEEHEAAMEIATQIYEMRTAAGLSQDELARLVGTSQSAISRLEDADYEGHSLQMLRRIAAALGRRVEVRFVTADPVAA